MTFLLLLPSLLSIVVLAAHFLRGGALPFVAILIVLLPLAAIPTKWVARAFQIFLVLGAAEWVVTLVQLVDMRATLGEPYMRMALILGAVAVVTAGSALLFETPRLRRFYGGRRPRPDETQ